MYEFGILIEDQQKNVSVCLKCGANIGKLLDHESECRVKRIEKWSYMSYKKRNLNIRIYI